MSKQPDAKEFLRNRMGKPVVHLFLLERITSIPLAQMRWDTRRPCDEFLRMKAPHDFTTSCGALVFIRMGQFRLQKKSANPANPNEINTFAPYGQSFAPPYGADGSVTRRK